MLLGIFVIDIPLYLLVIPIVVSILGPIILPLLLLSFIGISLLFRKKSERRDTKKILKNIFKKKI